MSASATGKIATTLGLSENELSYQALISFLREKKRETLHLKLKILARYGADSIDDLETRIAQGTVVEHPAWEDLIAAENLAARLEELDVHLENLRSAEGNRPERIR